MSTFATGGVDALGEFPPRAHPGSDRFSPPQGPDALGVSWGKTKEQLDVAETPKKNRDSSIGLPPGWSIFDPQH